MSDRGFGIAAGMMVLCCVAGPAVLGAVAGSAIGGVLGIAAAVLVALACLLLLQHLRGARDKAC